jgi:hypothetical protein
MPSRSPAQDAACAQPATLEFDPDQPPQTRVALHRAVREILGAHVPLTPLLDSGASDAPMDYLYHAFFEGHVARGDLAPGAPREPAAHRPGDCVVWANRGGGKTFLGAVATVLDLLYKPAVEVRILGGSLEQSRRMYEHLRRLFEIPAIAGLVDGKPTARGLRLANGSRVEILAQSESSVRGTRVQKLRCDEVELFERDLWTAAQLTTRSVRSRPGSPWGPWIRGAVEALSTMHKPHGLMWEIVGSAGRTEAAARTAPRRLFRWGVVDVLEHCTDEHACGTCTLEPDCGGRAKRRPEAQSGHVTVFDAVTMKSRVDESSWHAEMLCLRPRRGSCVYSEFRPERHVITAGHEPPPVGNEPADPLNPRPPGDRGFTLACGMDYGYRAESVILIARVDPMGDTRARAGDRDLLERAVITVLGELVATETTVDQHVARLRASAWLRAWGDPEWIGADPAGEQRSAQTGRSCADVLRTLGFRVRDKPMGLHDGLALVRRRFAPADGSPPRLFVHERCTRLIEALERYHYPEDKPESLDPVKDGMDHAADALRYLVIGHDRPNGAKLGRWA